MLEFLYLASTPVLAHIAGRVPVSPKPMFTGTCKRPQSRIEKVGRVCSKSLIENTLWL
jgi:hypothetical protein